MVGAQPRPPPGLRKLSEPPSDQDKSVEKVEKGVVTNPLHESLGTRSLGASPYFWVGLGLALKSLGG